ncbi:MAG: hypothetical protein QM742_15545 [Aquabacterium sp.]
MLSKSKLGGSQPDLRASLSGKVSVGAARMGTPLNQITALSAVPSLASKSRYTLLVLSDQSGSPGLPSAVFSGVQLL